MQPLRAFHLLALGDQPREVGAGQSWKHTADFLYAVCLIFKLENGHSTFVIPPDFRNPQACEYRELVKRWMRDVNFYDQLGWRISVQVNLFLKRSGA